MKIKLDEALSKSICTCLQHYGYSVATVRQQGWHGLKDPALWPLVKESNEFLITSDKGFGDIRVYPPGTHPGILLLRPDNESVAHFVELLESILKNHRLETLAGKVSVATPRSLRSRG